MTDSKGILAQIKNNSNSVIYSKFTVASLTKAITDLVSATDIKREQVIFTGGYGAALIRGDKVAIAEYQRQHRITRIGKYKALVRTYGSDNARVFISISNAYHQITNYNNLYQWEIYDTGFTYKGIGKDDMDSVTLTIGLQNNCFTLKVIADSSGGYGKADYEVTLSYNISFGSILNQIAFFSRRLKTNYYL